MRVQVASADAGFPYATPGSDCEFIRLDNMVANGMTVFPGPMFAVRFGAPRGLVFSHRLSLNWGAEVGYARPCAYRRQRRRGITAPPPRRLWTAIGHWSPKTRMETTRFALQPRLVVITC